MHLLKSLVIRFGVGMPFWRRRKMPEEQAPPAPSIPRAFREVYDLFRGALVALYGDFGHGKTTFCVHLCRAAQLMTGRPPLYLAVDENLKYERARRQLEALLGEGNVRFLDPGHVLYEVTELDARDRSIVVLDSITTVWLWLAESIAREVIEQAREHGATPEELLAALRNAVLRNPLLRQELITLAEVIAAPLARQARAHGIPVVVVVHSSAVFPPRDRRAPRTFWHAIGSKPSYMSKALRHAGWIALAVLRQDYVLELRVVHRRELMSPSPPERRWEIKPEDYRF